MTPPTAPAETAPSKTEPSRSDARKTVRVTMQEFLRREGSVLPVLRLLLDLAFLGACIAFGAAELTIGVVCHRALARYVRVGELAADAVKPVVAAGVMGLVMLALRASPLLALAAGCVAYPLLLRLVGALPDRDLELLRRISASLALPGAGALARFRQGMGGRR